MDPPPIDFTDEARARERSLFGLYQVIEQGLEGTAMPSFAQLSPDDRWALAFHVGRYAYPNKLARSGETAWSNDDALRRLIPNMTVLAGMTPAQLEEKLGAEKARAVTAYLRGNPEALSGAEGSLSLAKERLQEALDAYEAGQRARATDLALSAYLDGFEPVEPLLTARDASLMRRIEGAMAELRARIGRGTPVDEVRAQVAIVQTLFTDAEVQLIVLLAVIAVAMLRYSQKIPIAKFFTYSSALIAVLAVILAGKGVSALQEAGLIDVRPLAVVPRIDLLGLTPTVQSVLAQLFMLAAVLFGFWYNRRVAQQRSAQVVSIGRPA